MNTSKGPGVWALHAYKTAHLAPADARARIRRFLQNKSVGGTAALWLTEQGGRVDRYGPTVAARDECTLVGLRTVSDRLKRLFHYELQGPNPSDPNHKFDSALIGTDSSNNPVVRPQYQTFRYNSAKQGSNNCP
jgi:hypothetical protein